MAPNSKAAQPTKRSATPTAAVKIKRLAHHKSLKLPKYETASAAGLDLAAAVPAEKPLILKPGQRALVPTGLVIELETGFEAQVRPRSGLALRHGVTVLNSPGTIDADYRGEVGILLINLGQQPFTIERGDRVAQMVIAPVAQARLQTVKTVNTSKRGSGGFGSTGAKAASAKKPPPKKLASARKPAAKTTKPKPRRR